MSTSTLAAIDEPSHSRILPLLLCMCAGIAECYHIIIVVIASRVLITMMAG